jgi:hypothetical protein
MVDRDLRARWQNKSRVGRQHLSEKTARNGGSRIKQRFPLEGKVHDTLNLTIRHIPSNLAWNPATKQSQSLFVTVL